MKKVKRKTNKKKKLWEIIFMYASIASIFIIISIYAYRTIYYYKQFNRVPETAKFVDVLTNKKNIVYFNDGLYKEEDNNYFYYGKNVNNYLMYEGLLWRIIGIDKTGIKLISDENLTNLVWGNKTDFASSVIYNWLNKNDYLKNIRDNEKTLNNDWCNSSIDVTKYECKDNTSAKIGLISTDDFIKAGSDKSYLNNGTYYWTINTDKDKLAYYVHTEGGINNQVGEGDLLYSYGVRPVIYIDKNLDYIDGDGSINNPYIVTNSMITSLKTSFIGSYISYNKYNFRVLEQGEEYTKLILDGYLTNDNNEPVKVTYDKVKNSLDTFIKKFNSDDLGKTKFNKTEYNNVNNYDYSKTYDSYDASIGLPVVGDLFINDYKDCWLDTYYNKSQDLIYTVSDNSTLLADLASNEDNVRPIIVLKNSLNILDGKGTRDNPYVIGN